MEIYFDNAATTAIDLRVLEAMLPYLTDLHGNPSSVHKFGRRTRQAIEEARETVADLFSASPEEIYFTSGATEANNLILASSIHSFHLRHFITSPLEHHSVLQCLEHYRKNGQIRVSLLEHDAKGHLNLDHLEYLLKKNPASFVSLMHGNNEIGTINSIEKIANICRAYKAVFHSDTVQTVGKIQLNLSQIPVHFITGSAHKFHGPKGVGFVYVDKRIRLQPLMHGGAQERDLRAGTENVAGIVGLAEALSIAYQHREVTQTYLQKLKAYCIDRLKSTFADIELTGISGDPELSLSHVLNVSFPSGIGTDTLISQLDKRNIAVSGASACSQLSHKGSHVIKALLTSQFTLKGITAEADREYIRISFSKHNSLSEIDYLISELADIYSSRPGQQILAAAS